MVTPLYVLTHSMTPLYVLTLEFEKLPHTYKHTELYVSKIVSSQFQCQLRLISALKTVCAFFPSNSWDKYPAHLRLIASLLRSLMT